jgi:hypothetical protein
MIMGCEKKALKFHVFQIFYNVGLTFFYFVLSGFDNPRKGGFDRGQGTITLTCM